MHSAPLILVIITIVIALGFDFLNGVHDAANSIATIVTTRVLTPPQAVLWAAVFNFIAAFVFGTGVAHTVSSGLIRPEAMTIYVVLAGLIGAILWNLLTWYLALPTSSSHAIISALAGAAIASFGSYRAILFTGWHTGWGSIMIFLLLSPLIGMVLGYIIMHIVAWSSFKVEREKASRWFRRLQLVSAGAYSLGHGTNDAQKTMGIIVATLVATGYGKYGQSHANLFGRHHEISIWIILSCHAAIAAGTMIGGWKIVKTMGSRITPHLRPMGGFSAEMAAAITIALATVAKVPISTTHAIGGAISGVGATRGLHAVRWIWAKRIVYGWILTFPGAALVGAAAFYILHFTLEAWLGGAAAIR